MSSIVNRVVDPSEIKNDINGFDLLRCARPEAMKLLISFPNIGYGFLANMLSRFKQKGSTVETRPGFVFTRKPPMQTSGPITVGVSGKEVFVPVEGTLCEMFAMLADVNSDCALESMFSDYLVLPTPIMVRLGEENSHCLSLVEATILIEGTGHVNDPSWAAFKMIRDALTSVESSTISEYIRDAVVAEIFRAANGNSGLATVDHCFTAQEGDTRAEYLALLPPEKDYFQAVAEGSASVDISEVFLKPSVFLVYTGESGPRLYYCREFSEEVLRSFRVRGATEAPTIEIERKLALPGLSGSVPSTIFRESTVHDDMPALLNVPIKMYRMFSGQETTVERFFHEDRIVPITGMSIYDESGDVDKATPLVTMRPPVFTAGEFVVDLDRTAGKYILPISATYVLPRTSGRFLTAEEIRTLTYENSKEYYSEGFAHLFLAFEDYVQMVSGSSDLLRMLSCSALVLTSGTEYHAIDSRFMSVRSGCYSLDAAISELALCADGRQSALKPSFKKMDSTILSSLRKIVNLSGSGTVSTARESAISGEIEDGIDAVQGVSATGVEVDTSKINPVFVVSEAGSSIVSNKSSIGTFDRQALSGPVIGTVAGQSPEQGSLFQYPRELQVSVEGTVTLDALFAPVSDTVTNAQRAKDILTRLPALMNKISSFIETYSCKAYSFDRDGNMGPVRPRSHVFDLRDPVADGVLDREISECIFERVEAVKHILNLSGYRGAEGFRPLNTKLRKGMSALDKLVGARMEDGIEQTLEALASSTLATCHAMLASASDRLLYRVGETTVFSCFRGSAKQGGVEVIVPDLYLGKGFWLYNMRKVYMLMISALTLALAAIEYAMSALYAVSRTYSPVPSFLGTDGGTVSVPLPIYTFLANGKPLYPIVDTDIEIDELQGVMINTIGRAFPEGSLYYELYADLAPAGETARYLPVVLPGMGTDEDIGDEHTYFWSPRCLLGELGETQDTVHRPFNNIRTWISSRDYAFLSSGNVMISDAQSGLFQPVPLSQFRTSVIDANAVTGLDVRAATLRGRIDATYVFPFVADLKQTVSISAKMNTTFISDKPETVERDMTEEEITGKTTASFGCFTSPTETDSEAKTITGLIHTFLQDESKTAQLYEDSEMDIIVPVIGLTDPVQPVIKPGALDSPLFLYTWTHLTQDPTYMAGDWKAAIDATMTAALNSSPWWEIDDGIALTTYNLFLSRRRAYVSALVLARELLKTTQAVAEMAGSRYRYWFEYSATDPSAGSTRAFRILDAYGFGSLFGNCYNVGSGAASFVDHRAICVVLSYGSGADGYIGYDDGPISFSIPRENTEGGVVRIADASPYLPYMENGEWKTKLTYGGAIGSDFENYYGKLNLTSLPNRDTLLAKFKENVATGAVRETIRNDIGTYLAENIERFKVSDTVLDKIWLVIEKL